MNASKEKNDGITFRPLTTADIDAMIKVDEKIVQRARSSLFREKLEEQISKYGDESMGAFKGNLLIGYILAETKVYIYGSDDLSAWITLLGVDPDYQDRGIGTALTRRMIEYFIQKGVKQIRTIAYWSWGDLVEFFNSVGFKLSDYLTLELNIG
ncbi:MAG: GNAT family N-acetyltransferase [Candidatus Heimdallarchaeota archaeon]